MEINKEITETPELKELGKTQNIDETLFQSVINCVNNIIKDESYNQEILSHRMSSYITVLYSFVLEIVQKDVKGDTVIAILEDVEWEEERIKEVLGVLEESRSKILHELSSSISLPPHIVDVQWKLDSCIQSNQKGIVGEPVYLITLHTQEVNGKNSSTTFSCHFSQMIVLLTELRKASRTLQRFIQT